MPFTCACFCGLNGFCRRRRKKKRDEVEEEECEEVEQWRDQETQVWQHCCQSSCLHLPCNVWPGLSLLSTDWHAAGRHYNRDGKWASWSTGFYLKFRKRCFWIRYCIFPRVSVTNTLLLLYFSNWPNLRTTRLSWALLFQLNLAVENKSLQTLRSCPLHIPAALWFSLGSWLRTLLLLIVIPKKKKILSVWLISCHGWCAVQGVKRRWTLEIHYFSESHLSRLLHGGWIRTKARWSSAPPHLPAYVRST